MSAHEKAINGLIPSAESEADEKVKQLGKRVEVRHGSDGKPYNHCFWTEFFHKAMNRMAYAAGLRTFC